MIMNLDLDEFQFLEKTIKAFGIVLAQVLDLPRD